MSRPVVDVKSSAITNICLNPCAQNDITTLGTFGNAVGRVLDRSTTYFYGQSTSSIRLEVTNVGTGGSSGVAWQLSDSFRAGDVISWSYMIYNASGRNLMVQPSINQNYSLNIGVACGPGAWKYVTGKATVISDTSALRVGFYFGAEVGDVVYTTNCLIVRSDTLQSQFADGNTPGWKWLGAPGNSASVGYPYTLESIAGQPFATNTVANTIAASRPGATIGAQDGRALYTVYSLPDPASQLAEINPISVLGVGNSYQAGGMLFRTGSNTGKLDSAVRPNNGNFFRQIDGGRSAGVHVACLSVNDGVSRMTLSVDGGSPLSTNIDSGGSMTTTSSPTNVELITTGYTTGIAAYGYKGEHNDETRMRITAWLARKYGSPIPSGY